MDNPKLPTAQIESEVVVQAVQSSRYLYQPLQTPESLRFIKLLPGEEDSPVQISLHHGTLSDLPTVAAVSYEWGEKVRRHEVHCESQVLKATKNLLDLLKTLRSAGESRWLWIDALCINQDDLDERSQQVPLMADIYQKAAVVLVWLGQPLPSTHDLSQTIRKLSEAYDSMDLGSHITFAGDLGRFKSSSEIPGGSALEAITQEQSWIALANLLSKRSYFSRLWIVQEIVMSSCAIILWGTVRIDWKHFYKAASVIWFCEFLHVAVDFQNLLNVVRIGELNLLGSQYSQEIGLSSLLIRFSFLNSTNLRDRVFGLLGMLKSGPLKASILVDYDKSVEEVYRDTTASIISHEHHLGPLGNIAVEPSARYFSDIPSWVPMYHDSVFRGVGRFDWILDWSAEALESDYRIDVSCNVLTAYGVILDVVSNVSTNISSRNFKDIILSILSAELTLVPQLRSIEIKPRELEAAASRVLNIIDPALEGFRANVESFICLVARWIWTDVQEAFSHTKEMPNLETPEQYSSIAHWIRDKISLGSSSEDLIRKDAKLKWMIDLLSNGDGQEAESSLKAQLLMEFRGLGRNFFRGNGGLGGVGPFGDNTDNSHSAVQVGDSIVVLAGMATPVILRSLEDTTFSLIGVAYIGNLDEASIFMSEVARDLKPIRIR